MPTESHQRLVRHLREQADEAVRGIVRHHDDTLEVLARREDVDGETFKHRVELTTTLAETKYQHAATEGSMETTQTHIELFGEVAVVHLREGPTDGSVFALEVPTAEKLAAFAADCRSILDSERTAHQAVATGD